MPWWSFTLFCQILALLQNLQKKHQNKEKGATLKKIKKEFIVYLVGGPVCRKDPFSLLGVFFEFLVHKTNYCQLLPILGNLWNFLVFFLAILATSASFGNFLTVLATLKTTFDNFWQFLSSSIVCFFFYIFVILPDVRGVGWLFWGPYDKVSLV